MPIARLVAFLALLAALSPAYAWGETRAASGFTEIHAEGRYEVLIEAGREYSLIVEGPAAAEISTRVEGERLEIKPRRRRWFGDPHYDAIVRVALPALEGVSAARGARVRAVSGGACAGFSAAAVMGGQLRVDGLRCGSVEAAAAMGGVLRLSGVCESLDVSAAMGGQVEARALPCLNVDASAAMGGSIEAYAQDSFAAAASMGGAIGVAGPARSLDASAVMGGAVSRRPPP